MCILAVIHLSANLGDGDDAGLNVEAARPDFCTHETGPGDYWRAARFD